MVYIKSYRGQNWLFPPNLEDLIPEDHICYIVESFVDSLDFNEFDIKYAGPGHPAYHPRIILKILAMGFMDKVRSSRKLARNARENVVYIYLSEKLSPDFRTISDFRKNNPKLIKEAFKHTVTIAKNEGLLDLSCLSTDGSKVKANAANRSVLTKEELLFLSNFIDNELEEWAKQDELEDDFFGEVRGSDQLPKKSKKKMKRAAQHYIKELKEKGKLEELRFKFKEVKEEVEENELEKVSLTDPEARFMKSKKGRVEFSYNTQLTTDNQGFILANDVCQDEVDNDQLKPQVLQTEENLGETSENIPWNFDNGYFDGENIGFALTKKIDLHLACQEKKNENPYDAENFIYDKEKDEYICPENKRLKFLSDRFDKTAQKSFKLYKGQSCEDCPMQKYCTKSKRGIRYLKRYPYEEERRKLKAKMKTKKAKEIYRRRKETVEPVFGDIKENKGMVNFLTKGLKKARIEFNLVCIGSNLRRMQTLMNNKIKPP